MGTTGDETGRLQAGPRRRLLERPPFSLLRDLSLRGYIIGAYRNLLLRDPDPAGLDHYRRLLTSGELTREAFLETIRGSEEFRFRVRFTDLLNSLHLSRCDFVRGLPRARQILDIGGTHQSNVEGAFVGLGYPYPFERLVIVDLPLEARHELYAGSRAVDRVDTPLGPVWYRYHSMTDLSAFEDGDFDLVYCGQTIEHVAEEDADLTLKEVFRVLRPGGWLGLDTPNGRVCRMQQDELINPDHRVEYTHPQVVAKLERAGFEILEAKGLNYAGAAAHGGPFSTKEVAANQGVYWEIEDCYLLAYVCRRP
ncbi:MAG: methyltransferase domain-containing protein [Actinomycetota bacterium]